jgi:hypothetical protein
MVRSLNCKLHDSIVYGLVRSKEGSIVLLRDHCVGLGENCCVFQSGHVGRGEETNSHSTARIYCNIPHMDSATFI